MDNVDPNTKKRVEVLKRLAEKYNTTVEKWGWPVSYFGPDVRTPWGCVSASPSHFKLTPQWTSDNPEAVIEWMQEVQDFALQHGIVAVPIVQDWKSKLRRKVRSYNDALEILKAIGTRVPGGGPLHEKEIQWERYGAIMARDDGHIDVYPVAQYTSEGLQKQAEWLSQVAAVLAEFE